MITNASQPLIRPRPASVIAVIWLYLGGTWAFMGIIMAAFWAWMLASVPTRSGQPLQPNMVFMYVWVLAVVALGAAGIWGARGLLELRASSRALLEKLNFVTAGVFALFGFYWAHDVLSMRYIGDLQFKLALGSVVTTCISSVPFFWMAKALRGRDVRNACEAARR